MAEKKFLDYDGLVYLLKGLPKYRIRVTYAEEFKGKISTCKRVDGTGNPYSKPIPTGSPYVLTFVVDGPGKWEISCDESAAIVDVTELKTYEIQLNSFDFKQWMIAGDIKNNPFATLDELLDDEKSIRQLITKHSSVDYMVNWFRAKTDDANIVLNNRNVIKWINLRDYALDKLEEVPAIKTIMDNVGLYGYGEVGYKNIVPGMASNNGPFGIVTSDSQISGYNDYYAFDNKPETAWNSDYSQPRHYLCYQFTEAKVIDLFIGEAAGNASSGFTATVYGSNNGNDWTKLGDSIRIEKSAKNNERVKVTIPLDNKNPYTHYKIENLMDGNYWTGYYSAEFHSFELLGLVPDMREDTAPYGSAIGSTIYKGYNPYRVFAGKSKPLYATLSDNDPNCWAVSGKNGFIGYKFVKPTEVTKLMYIPRWEEGSNVYKQSPKTWNLEYSDDGNTWTSIASFTETSTTSPEIRMRGVNKKPGYHIYWRMNVTENLGESYTAIARLQFYGRQLTDLIPAMNSAECPRGKLTGKVSPPAGAANSNIWTLFDKKIDARDARNYNTFEPNGHEWYQFEFANPTKVKMMMFTGNYDCNSYYADYKFSVRTSSDGFSYDVLTTDINKNSKIKYLILDVQDNDFENKFWKVNVDHCSNQNGLSELTFFGPDYSEHEFGDDNFLQIYDHGISFYDNWHASTGASYIGYGFKNDVVWAQSGTSSSNSYVYYGVNDIDLTPFNMYYGRSRNLGSGNKMHGLTIGRVNNTNEDAVSWEPNNQLPDFYLDISSFNDSSHILYVASGSGSGYIEFTELYLI